MSGWFSEFPDAVRLPFAYAEFDPSQADRGLAEMPSAVLLVGQMLAEGQAEPLTLMRPTTLRQAEVWFGAGSQLCQMVAGYLGANKLTRMYALGVRDFEGGVAAAGSLTLSGEVQVPTPLCLYIGGMLVRLGVAAGQTPAQIIPALAALINSRADLPVTAEVGVESLILTAKHKGECGNDIDLRLSYLDEDLPAGLKAEITPLTGGAGNHETLDIIAALGDQRFHLIAWPWTNAAALAPLKTELDARWGPLRQIDGQAVLVKTGNFAEVCTYARAHNHKHLTVIPSEGSPTLPWVDAAACVAILAYYGADDPARPFQSLAIPGVLAPAVRDRWADFPERNQALYEGVSVRGVTESGQVIFLNVITTYRTNEWGGETRAYLQLNTMLTLSYLRYDWNNYIKTKYPRHKLADDDAGNRYGPDQPIMMPVIMRAECISRMREWMRKGLVEAPEDFESRLAVARDKENPNRLNVLMMPDLVNQFRIAATCIRFLL